MLTAKGTLSIGLELNGLPHCDYELVLLTAGQAIDATEKAIVEYGNEVDVYRLRAFELAEQLLSLGSLFKVDITGPLLLTLPSVDYDELTTAALALQGKCQAAAQARRDAAAARLPPAEHN